MSVYSLRICALLSAMSKFVINSEPRSHDPANVQQTSSKCIQNTLANCSAFAGNLLDVYWTFAGSCKWGI